MREHRLANRIKELRVQANLTQAQLAENVGVSRKTINTIENGVFSPSLVLAMLIARELNRGVEDVFSLREAGDDR